MTDTQTTQTIAEVAESPSTTNTNVTQAILEISYTPAEVASNPPGSGGGAVRRGRIPVSGKGTPLAEWSIDGRAVPLDWDPPTMIAPGGFDQMRGRVAARRFPRNAGQGSIVLARRPNGQILWLGRIIAPPKVREGIAQFDAAGPKSVLELRAERLPYQLWGGTYWSDRESDPFGYNNSEKFTLFSKGPALGWAVDNATSYTSGFKSGYALYARDWPFRRISFTIHKSTDDSNFALKLYTSDALGALAELRSWSMGSGNPDPTSIDTAIAPADTLSLVLESTNTATPGAKEKFWIADLHINGVGIDDEATTSDIMVDLSNRSDYDPDAIADSSLAALPLDWDSSWDQLADYLAGLDDWVWIVEEDSALKRGGRMQYFGGMRYNSWGRDGEGEWKGQIHKGIVEDLTLLPLYNRVTVYYESPPGVSQALTVDVSDVADLDDPLARKGYVSEYPTPFRIAVPQFNNNLAASVGATLLRRLTKQRVQGTVKVTRLHNGQPFDMRAGDTLNITDFTPKIPPQRITQCTYNPDGTVDISLERSFDLGIVMRKLQRGARRRGLG